MSNIIDFNSYKRSREPEPVYTPHEAEALATLNMAFGSYLHVFPSNALMLDIHARVGERFMRLEVIESVSDRVCGTIAAAGLDAENFRIDPVAFERFMTREIDFTAEQEAGEWSIPPELYWNGPYYDWKDQGTLFRAATTVLRHESGEVELLVDLVKMEEGSQHWLMWHDGVWETDDFLEAIEEELRQRQIEALGPAALGYEDEWENSIDSMLLPPSVITALHGAGVDAIDELKYMTDDELLRIKGIGKKSLKAIHEALEYEE